MPSVSTPKRRTIPTKAALGDYHHSHRLCYKQAACIESMTLAQPLREEGKFSLGNLRQKEVGCDEYRRQ